MHGLGFKSKSVNDKSVLIVYKCKNASKNQRGKRSVDKISIIFGKFPTK